MQEVNVADSDELELRALRRRRDGLLDALAGLPADAPEAVELCCRVGELSHRMLLLRPDPDDLSLAEEAFELAFRAAGEGREWGVLRVRYGHVLMHRHDTEPTGELLARATELVEDGMTCLEGGGKEPQDDEVHRIGRYLLAYCAKRRCVARLETEPFTLERAAWLDDAIRLHERALDVLPEGDEAAVDLHEALGFLHLERCRVADGAAHTEAAVRHYRTVLDAALPGSDLPGVHYSVGIALQLHGRAAGDQAELEEAREEFGTALLLARQAGQRPAWAWEAEIRAVFVRVLIWSTWKDQAHAAAGEVELNDLLARPGAVDRLSAHYLDGFGRLLFERTSLRGDKAGQDRAVALVRRAVAEWNPEQDGRVTVTAFMLAAFQQGRYEDDQDLDRLGDVLDGARLVLADEEPGDGGIGDDIRQLARVMISWVGITRRERGVAPGTEPGEELDFDQSREAYLAMLGDFEQGQTFLDFSPEDDEYPGLMKGIMGPSRLPSGFDTVYRRWHDSADDPGATVGGRAEMALFILNQIPLFDAHGNHVTAEQKAALVACVQAHRPDDPEWRRKAHGVLAQLGLWEEMSGSGHGLDAVMDHLAQAEAAGGDPGDRIGEGIGLTRMLATRHRGEIASTGDDRDAADADWRRLREMSTLSPHMRRVFDAQQASFEAHTAAQRGDVATADERIGVVLDTYASLAPDDPVRAEMWTHVENARASRDDAARRQGLPPAPPPPGRPTLPELRRMAARLPRDHHAWVLGDNGIARFARAAEAQDFAAVGDALALVKEAYEMVDEGSDSRLRYAHVLGSGHCLLAEAQALPAARTRHLTRGIALLEAAFAATGGPEHRLHAASGLALARAYRNRGDRAASRRTGLDGLRGHAWAVLLQSGTDHAAQAAVQATSSALEVAGWCLRDNEPREALAALDACRGLVLHAATTSRTVPERLAAAGRTDLADQWRAAAPATGEAADPLAAARSSLAVPSALRRHVLTALTDAAGGTQDRLLEPPAPDEIGTALRALRKDALVYLVPASDDVPGTAVVVTSRGDVHAVPLPRLADDAGPLTDYVRANRVPGNRDLGPVTRPGPPPRDLRGALDRLCSWAWYAAVRPLFDVFAAPGREARLVFVPMGSLGLVPWHAAWTEGDDGRRRYALNEAEISYAASARLLCDVAARPAAEHRGRALVVGNPTGDLRYAGEEADAVQRAFYPAGRFLGRRAGGAVDGPGTAGEVMEWLRGDDLDAPDDTGAGAEGEGAVLHLACHAAVAREARRTAHLALHGGELTAEELTEAIGGGRRGGLGLVLLAACRSHVSGRGDNEAYSLATAFLVAGARSVVGSLWPVPDDATSVLMYLTHHYLRVGGLPPARALRAAQLWMLDPDRELPAGFPERLAAGAGGIEPDDLSAWAGFTHLGQ
ncbi:CHAT domain-containing protein [Streptomyces sp. KL116D]|uniref:CHAT domain-containing protein n=1 Tax=Streptomyces sp. KL116D TaxID=3045152 RepID=UPI003559174F